jgi:hypothetical protein
LWTSAEDALLRETYPDKPTRAVAQLLGLSDQQCYIRSRRLGLRKSEAFTRDNLRRLGNLLAQLPAAIACRIKPGTVPVNKGTRSPGYAPGRMTETQFRKGQRSCTWKPVGTVLKDGDGYLRIKIRERVEGDGKGWNPEIWPPVHRRNWEKLNGPVPAGHIVVFKDRNKEHCEVENLELITMAENALRNSIHKLPPELKEVVMLKGRLKRRIHKMEKEIDGKERNSGFAQPSL